MIRFSGALALTGALSVRSEGDAPNEHSLGDECLLIRYVFPGTPFTADKTVAVTWYDGNQLPPEEIQAFAKTGTLPDGKPAKVPDQGGRFSSARMG